jgi:DNA (cytosine-5)-methyltransferase 1
MTYRSEIRAKKLERIRDRKAPRVLELCSGCGGMSLGLATAGFELVAHVEFDAGAADSYALNFEVPAGVDAQEWAKARDMEVDTAEDIVRDLGLETATAESFDVLAAGLPCQAFARIGRSKLASVKGEEDAYRNDPRAKLYKRFLEYVDTTQPVAVIIENVPDILNFGGHNVPEEICATLEQRGYRTGYTLLNAAFFGVPQMRERLFLVAIDQSLGVSPTFPAPTHHLDLPSGYESVRSVALRHVPDDGRFMPPEPAPNSLPSAVTVRAALSDLPHIIEHVRAPRDMRKRKVGDRLPYRKFTELTTYQRQMREWAGFKSFGDVDGSVVRLTPRDFPIFKAMPIGADYPRARKIAEALFEDRLKTENPRPPKGSVRWLELQGAHVPPYDAGKFPNKWWKMDPAMPSRTLTAHMGKDTYSHIHWDSRQQRTVSVREAARLQSFPDAFRFSGAMNATYRQIGNAVPPILSLAVATAVLNVLRKIPALPAKNSSKAA